MKIGLFGSHGYIGSEFVRRGNGFQDLTSKKFNRWTVIEFISASRKNGTIWNCRCDCGTERHVKAGNLTRGLTKSCGCFKSQVVSERNTTHGHSKHPIYAVWSTMVQRCTNPNDHNWKNYGARGITVCDSWRTFERFFDDMVGEWKKGLTLERINNSAGYSKLNCKWATQKEQMNNTRSNRFLIVDGVCLTVSQWADRTGISRKENI